MTAPYYQDDLVTLYLGDCVEVMATLPADSVDSIVTDPPYGLGFMGKAWDALPPGEEWARECLRVLKPGGHLLAFGGTRTWHRLAVAVEDAGFELRDSIAWLYGSGFPKSLDVSKAIDKAAGAERPTYARAAFGGTFSDDGGTTYGTAIDGTPITDAAREWQGWGTALKPAFEPIVVGRRPLIGTVAANVLMHGTGALNIDGCRVGDEERHNPSARTNGLAAPVMTTGRETTGRWPANVVLDPAAAAELDAQTGIMRDGVAVRRNGGGGAKAEHVYAGGWGSGGPDAGYGGSGGASRFFFVPGRQGSTLGSCDPVSTAETTSSPPRPSVDSAPGDAATSARPGTSPASSTAPSTIGTASGSRPSAAPGTQEIPSTASECSPESPQPSSTPSAGPANHAVPIEPTGTTRITTSPSISSGSADDATSSATSRSAEAGAAGFPSFRYQAKAPRSERPVVNGLSHSTVKPLTLMRWLVRLVTPPGGVVLEPFLGSGTTAQACELEGFRCIGVEREQQYMDLVRARLGKPIQPDIFGGAS